MEADTGSTPLATLDEHLSRRNGEYKALRRGSVYGTDGYPYAPWTWPAGRCMLTDLPTELLLMIIDPLHQADLFHVAATCRRLAAPALDLLYQRDVANFDCISLRWACIFGVMPTLERALEYGASPNHTFGRASDQQSDWLPGAPGHCDFCRTPLMTAVSTSGPEIVGRLLAHGADPCAPDPRKNERNPSPHFHRSRVFAVLYPIHLAMGTPDLPFCPSFRPGDPRIVRRLLDAGADPNQYTMPGWPIRCRPRFMGWPPLLMAMQACVPVETVRLLLEHGARATAPGSFDGLVSSVRGGRPAHFWDCSPLGTILFWSGRSDIFPLDLDKIRLLLAHGSAHELLDVKDGSGASHPMPLLCRHWHHIRIVEILKLFVAAGADIASWADMVIPPIFTALWWAEHFVPQCRREQNDAGAEAAIDKVCNVITVLAEATLAPDQRPGPVQKSTIIDAVVSRSRLDLSDFRVEQTALRYVCTPFPPRDLISFIPVLLRYGAEMNSPDRKGRTALHYAAMFCFQGLRIGELVGFLGGPAPSGLDIDAVDARGWTPLHFACLLGFWSEPFGQVTAARLLLEHGANVRQRTNSGWTPLALSVLCANLDLVNMLLDHGADVQDLFRTREGATDPTPVQIGRILFVGHREPDWPTTRALQMAGQLANTTASVAALLHTRLGILLPAPAPPPRGSPGSQSQSRNQSPSPSRVSRSHVQFVDHPFGVAWMGGAKYADEEFETYMELAFEKIDELGLMAWIVPVREWERVRLRWCGAGLDE